MAVVSRVNNSIFELKVPLDETTTLGGYLDIIIVPIDTEMSSYKQQIAIGIEVNISEKLSEILSPHIKFEYLGCRLHSCLDGPLVVQTDMSAFKFLIPSPDDYKTVFHVNVGAQEGMQFMHYWLKNVGPGPIYRQKEIE